MSAPRIEIDLAKVAHNASTLVQRMGECSIAVTGVTKAVAGHPVVVAALVDAGVAALGDSRLAHIEAMQASGVDAPMVLVRSPMPSEVERVVASGVTSLNSELEVIGLLSVAARAQGRVHPVVLMVELGDLREGVMASQAVGLARRMAAMPGIRLRGIGANLACRSGVVPDMVNMDELSRLADEIEAGLEEPLELISGGSSANLDWVLGGADPGRVNDVRLGEAIYLGCEPLRRTPVPGLHTDAFCLVGEVIESMRKPSKPWGRRAEAAFGEVPEVDDRGEVWQTIVALGRQDTDPDGLGPPDDTRILASSSDHLITETNQRRAPGCELRFRLDYSALARSMTAPDVAVVVT